MKKGAAKKEFALGLPVKGKITPLPKVKKPQVWQFSAHPHETTRSGNRRHIDIRLGDPNTFIAHSFVLPKAEMPAPGKAKLLIPTNDHTMKYMDFTGTLGPGYGAGRVIPGRRTAADVYHAEPGDAPGTKLRFNLYEGDHPEEFAMVQTSKGQHLLVNKTQTRERRPDIPDFKAKYKSRKIDEVNPNQEGQVLMPKLDGAHTLIDLQAGRAPRVFSHRIGKLSTTGLIEHSHKIPELLKTKVPKSLDGTILRAETMGMRGDKPLPSEQTGGLLNAKVWESRRKQQDGDTRLKVFPFSVVRYKGKDVSGVSFEEKQRILTMVRKFLPDLGEIPVARTVAEKVRLLREVKSGKHPLTSEGVVAVDPSKSPEEFVKSKVTPDFDVFIRGVKPAVSGKTGKPHDRAGRLSYSWTPDGPVVGEIGTGWTHAQGRDMLKNPKKYIGNVAKVEASRIMKSDALFQASFKGMHLDKVANDPVLLAMFVEFEKMAAEIDPAALEKFYAGLQPGDVINFERKGADIARKGIGKGLMHGAISAPIQKITGSPEHHTAIYIGKDSKTGKALIAHNFEQGGKSGVQLANLDDFAETSKLHAYRPKGVTPEQGMAAAQEARALAEKGGTRYSKRNLVAAGLQQFSDKAKSPMLQKTLAGAAARVGEVCDPGTGICSALPAEIYQKAWGKEKALQTFAGKAVRPEAAGFSVTPGTIRESAFLSRVGEYSPAKPESSVLRAGAARAGDVIKGSKAGGRVQSFLSSLRKMPRIPRFA